jgi:hypothetical protein
MIPALTSYQIAIGIAAIVIGGLEIAIGWGLWTTQEWARVGAIVLLALSAIANLFAGVGSLAGVRIGGQLLSYPGPGIASLVIAGLEAWAIWYLLRTDIAQVFRGDMMPDWPPAVPETVQQPVTTAPPPPAPEPARPPRADTVWVGREQPPAAWLVLRSGSRSGKQFGLRRGRNTVGRDPGEVDIVLEESTVSGEHASIRFQNGQFYVTDLDSTNGTRVNNRLVQRQMLMNGDVLHFGNARMVFVRVD